MIKAVKGVIVSFVVIYATCILFGNTNQDLPSVMLQYLFWSLPAAVIIGFVTYLQTGGRDE